MTKNRIQLILYTSHLFYKRLFKQIFIYLLKKNKVTNCFFKETSLRKNKKFTLLKSPHIFKNARDQFEIRKNVVFFCITNFTSVEFIKILNILKFLLEHLLLHITVAFKSKLLKGF